MSGVAPERLPIDDAGAAFLSQALKLDGFFPEFTAEHAVKLFPHSGLFIVHGDFHIIEQGDPGRDLFILYSGRVEIRKSLGNASTTLATLGPGDLLGEIALLRDGVRGATAVAIDRVHLFMLAFVDLHYILTNNTELAEHLRTMARARLGIK